MALSKIAKINEGFKHQLNKLLAKKCRIYIAMGEFDETDIPTDKAELATLYSATGSFLPLGDMDNSGSNISWTEKTYKTDFSTVGMGYDVNGNFVGVTVTAEMLDFVSDLGHGAYSFLFVPDKTDDIFFALSGVTLTTDGNLAVVEGDTPSKITFKASRGANKITDVVKFKELSN